MKGSSLKLKYSFLCYYRLAEQTFNPASSGQWNQGPKTRLNVRNHKSHFCVCYAFFNSELCFPSRAECAYFPWYHSFVRRKNMQIRRLVGIFLFSYALNIKVQLHCSISIFNQLKYIKDREAMESCKMND